ncbi:hypothetical protein MCC_07385 [Rickettsia rhipicephali str. 3-7-female6-CWPP]|uniref:Uncharacterized protein n=1 Tax=Rickettsia rhipicephali (strain 3-7-female6-CWPP) TaxID=1105113 RepID=A0AAI8AAT8_RICR3|nr:hypothetical protein [Rickettsia rhipicephali]AFC72932.1 hypothetical protein MCC_07385 [Rickettsia rhipicephali str. 3-7-female6-CWPP]
MNGISSEIKDLISNPISSTTQGTSTIKNLLELITKDLSEIAANPINNTLANLTNTAFNTTYNSQENMFDENDNDNSLVVAQYISILAQL